MTGTNPNRRQTRLLPRHARRSLRALSVRAAGPTPGDSLSHSTSRVSFKATTRTRHLESLPKEPARQAAFGAHRRDAMAISRLIDEARQVGYCVAEARSGDSRAEKKRGWSAHGTLAPEVRARRVVVDPAGRGRA